MIQLLVQLLVLHKIKHQCFPIFFELIAVYLEMYKIVSTRRMLICCSLQEVVLGF